MKKSVVYILIIIFGVITYFPSFSGSLFWDDTDFILENEYVKTFQIDKFFTKQAVEGSNKDSNYFRPIQFSLYTVLYAINGPSPLLFHAASIFIHISATIMVYVFIHSLFTFLLPDNKHTLTSILINNSQIFALVISLIFLIHPVQTEAVSYVSGISDPLVTFFGFLSLLLLIKTPTTNMPFASLIAYILSLFSKESGVIFLGIIILLWVFNTAKLKKKINIKLGIEAFRRIGMFLLITITYLIYHFQIIQQIDMSAIWGDHPYTYSPILRIITFLSLLPHYIFILIFPKDLFYDRDFSVIIPTTVWHFPSFLVLFSLTTVFVLLLIRYKSHPIWSISLFFFLGFFVAFLPFSGILLINGLMYEHFLYIPLVFFFSFLLLLAILFISTRKNKKTFYRLLYVLLLFLLGFWMIRSWIRQYDWQDPLRLYTHTLRYVPNSFRVRNNLAMEYHKRGEIEKAIVEYNRVITLNPSLPNSYHNLGNLYLEQKQYQKAENYLLKALEVNPTFYFSYEALLRLYSETGETEKIKLLLQTLESLPSTNHK